MNEDSNPETVVWNFVQVFALLKLLQKNFLFYFITNDNITKFENALTDLKYYQQKNNRSW